jgi:hypothetical protein
MAVLRAPSAAKFGLERPVRIRLNSLEIRRVEFELLD